MAESKISQSAILRLCISFVLIFLPAIFLIKGIFGSFIFTFSIPIIWQVSFLGKPISSLGIKFNSIKSSIIIGVITGLSLGFIGGNLLKVLGVTRYVFTTMHKLQFNVGQFCVAFPLQKELGYRLLTASNSTIGLFIYLMFSILVIGLGEELFWRGFIQSKISDRLPVNVSIWLTAILFALIHCYIFTILPIKIGISFLALIFIVGLIWGYLFKYFNNVWSPAISHGVVAFIIWKYYFFNH